MWDKSVFALVKEKSEWGPSAKNALRFDMLDSNPRRNHVVQLLFNPLPTNSSSLEVGKNEYAAERRDTIGDIVSTELYEEGKVLYFFDEEAKVLWIRDGGFQDKASISISYI